MPRDGSNVYHRPAGTDAVPNTSVESSKYNNNVADVEQDLNTPRPIVAGGTGANNAATALINLSAETALQLVTNYASNMFVAGSFYSAATATGAPVAGHAFVGICWYVDANNMFIEARDRDDSVQPGARYVRQMKAGVWSSWIRSDDINAVASGLLSVSGTPALNNFATWAGPTALGGVAITGLVKGNGASPPAAAVANTDYLPISAAALSASPAVDNNTTLVATTAYVLGQAGAAAPAMNGVAAAGSAIRWARQDHVHPVDTSRMAVAGGQTITGGFRITSYNIGTLSSGSYAPDPYNGNYQYYTNNGAHTLSAPSSDCAIDVLITNGASAGNLALSGYTIAAGNAGDPYVLNNAYHFIFSIRRIASVSTLVIKALQ
jgi:hypothetical protein